MTNHLRGGKPGSVRPHRTVKETGMSLDDERIIRKAYK
jgi:hypothetical protein